MTTSSIISSGISSSTEPSTRRAAPFPRTSRICFRSGTIGPPGTLRRSHPSLASIEKASGWYIIYNPRDTGAAWFQDNWSVTKDLILNFGLRYDVSLGSIGDRVGELLPFRTKENIKPDLLNFAPRLGFAYSLPDKKTVIRGGWGKDFAEPLDNPVHWTQMSIQTVVPTTNNDGRANFAADPLQRSGADQGIHPGERRAPRPGRQHDRGQREGRLPQRLQKNQASIGFQRQITETMGVEADAEVHRRPS